MIESLSMINPAALDTSIITLVDRLQRIEDPRVRFAVITYMFTLYTDALGLNRAKVLAIAERGVKFAREHNTSEMRGLDMYLKKECR